MNFVVKQPLFCFKTLLGCLALGPKALLGCERARDERLCRKEERIDVRQGSLERRHDRTWCGLFILLPHRNLGHALRGEALERRLELVQRAFWRGLVGPFQRNGLLDLCCALPEGTERGKLFACLRKLRAQGFVRFLLASECLTKLRVLLAERCAFCRCVLFRLLRSLQFRDGGLELSLKRPDLVFEFAAAVFHQHQLASLAAQRILRLTKLLLDGRSFRMPRAQVVKLLSESIQLSLLGRGAVLRKG
mmetsp:Transcript_19166/g.61334  ORF Transcript_19166/g.61334 Transcript_19166/m.61334 type:complete len:248 (-) Transcript_19166:761-1504(-)